MKALLFYTSRITSHNMTVIWRSAHYTQGRVGTSYEVALEDPAEIFLYELASRSYGARQVQHFSYTVAEEKQQFLSEVCSLRGKKTCARPSTQGLPNNSTAPQELKRAGERWHSSSLVSKRRNIHWQRQAVVPNAPNLPKLHILSALNFSCQKLQHDLYFLK